MCTETNPEQKDGASQSSEDRLIFQEEGAQPNEEVLFPQEGWKVLVVDDEGDVHQITHMVLDDFTFEDKPLCILSAYSAEEAKSLLEQHPDSALMFLDVVMESYDAGLKLVKYIRETLNNPFIHIILRTGQPGYAPEKEIVRKYEINGYTNKAELTAQKMFTLVTSSLRSYSELITIETYRQQLEKEVEERTRELVEKNTELQNLNETLKKMNEDLIKLNQDKNEFLGIAAHDLKNPLASIQGLAELIERCYDTLPKGEVIGIASMIRFSSIQMFEFIRNILDVNAIESGHFKVSLEVIDIHPILQSLVNEYTKFAKRKGISLSFHCAVEQLLAFADAQMVRQVLDNLISNAVKYSSPGKSIHIRVNHRSSYISCEIEDEGPGLSEEEQQKLFNKFARLTPRPTGDEHSTGLGLFIVKKLVEIMHGQVACKSQLGQGSIFTVEFPGVGAERINECMN